MNNTLLLLVFGIVFTIVITIPMNSFGYSFVGVTTNGVEFPILSSSVSDGDMGKNATSILDGLGVYLTIQNISTNGVVYFGEEDTPGKQTDIRAYVEVNDTDDWVIVIDDDDYTEILAVPEFGVQYEYVSGVVPSIVDVTTPSPNILGYTTSKSMSGVNNIHISNDGIIVDGTGIVVIKLHDYTDSILIRGTIHNADVKFVTSPLDLTTLHLQGNDYVIYENFNPSKTLLRHDSLYHFEYATHPNLLIAKDAPLSAIYEYNITHVEVHPNCGKNGCTSPTIHNHPYSGTLPTLIISENILDGTLVTKLSSQYSSDKENDPSMDSPGFRVQYMISPAPWNVQYSYDDTFEQNVTLPENSYMIVTLSGGSAIIKGETFDPTADIFFQVDGLLPDIAYDVSKSGIIGVVGKTSSTGEISLLLDDVDFGISTSPGGILQIYPDSVQYLGDFGVGLIDVYNEESITLPIPGDNLAYIPQNYVYWVFPVGIEVDNLQIDDIPLNYLNKNYSKNEALYIPVIPGADTIHGTINGTDVEILMKDVATTTQIKQVPQESSVSSDYSIDGTVTVSSNISTSTFLTATHTGVMNVNLDLRVGGAVDYTMDSTHTGEFVENTSCRWHGASSPSRSYSCNTYSTPANPESISNIDSLTADHRTQLTAALQRGQASNITVEVDILRNMQTIETILVYTSDSAQASVTSTLNTAGFGASNQVHMTYPMSAVFGNIAVPVNVGDMMEFVVRVNLEVSGAPTPASESASYLSYVQATTEFGGGVITVGMS